MDLDYQIDYQTEMLLRFDFLSILRGPTQLFRIYLPCRDVSPLTRQNILNWINKANCSLSFDQSDARLNSIIIELLKTEPIHLMWSIQVHATWRNTWASRNFFFFLNQTQKTQKLVPNCQFSRFLKSDQIRTDGLRNTSFRFSPQDMKDTIGSSRVPDKQSKRMLN